MSNTRQQHTAPLSANASGGVRGSGCFHRLPHCSCEYHLQFIAVPLHQGEQCALNMQRGSVGVTVTATSGSTSWSVCRGNSSAAIELLLATSEPSTSPIKTLVLKDLQEIFLPSQRVQSPGPGQLLWTWRLVLLEDFDQVQVLLLSLGGTTSSTICSGGTKETQSRRLL